MLDMVYYKKEIRKGACTVYNILDILDIILLIFICNLIDSNIIKYMNVFTIKRRG